MVHQSSKTDSIFWSALSIAAPEERSRYLDEACGDDPNLRAQLDELLAAYPKVERFMERPAIATNATLNQPAIAEGPGTVIGPYKLLQQIGEGGMGVVFMADQTEPIQRTVALKIIKPGMDTRQVIARFEAERQALALMDHPNIARVLDACTTETGRPYFVMELVKGIPITDYCDEHRLTPRERLELLIPVCQAVQHAHQKGIIHRDLKPTNVLVADYDDHPVPKVIDFGVAKAIGQHLTEKTVFTEFGQVVGTIEYMSPEQAKLNQLDIDTRTDIYSMGVLLYELLTGETPFDKKRLHSAAFDEMLRIIREEEPPKPSTRLSSSDSLPSIAANRHLEPKKLTTLVSGDLDWIVMKSLEKDRTRRYETASGLVEDLQRYLCDQPVVARPPSAAYRFRKFARRNKPAFISAALIAIALIAGIVVSTWQAVRATQAEAQAEANEQQAIQERDDKEKARREAVASAQRASAAADAERQAKEAETAQRVQAEEVTKYLISAFNSPNPYYGGHNITIAEVLERDVRELQTKFADNPRLKAALLEAIGTTYVGLGLFREAIPLLEESLQLRKAILGSDHPETLSSMQNLQWAYNRAGRISDSLPLAEEALRRKRAVLGSDDPATTWAMNNLALDYWGSKRKKDAQPLLEEAFNRAQAKFGSDHLNTLGPASTLGTFYLDFGRLEEGIQLLETTLEASKAKLGAEHENTLWTMDHLANAYARTQRLPQAVQLLEEAIKLSPARLGPDHPETVSFMSDLALCYEKLGRLDDALGLWKETVKIRIDKLGPNHPDSASSISKLLAACKMVGQYGVAVELMEDVTKTLRTKLGTDHPDTLVMAAQMGHCYNRASLVDEAVAILDDTLKRQRAKLGSDHPDILVSIGLLATAHRSAGRPLLALPLYEEEIKLQQAKFGTDGPAAIKSMIALADFCTRIIKDDRHAISIYEELVKLQPKVASHYSTLAQMLGECPDPKLRDERRALELASKAVAIEPNSSDAWFFLGTRQHRAGNWQAAIDAMKKSDETSTKPKGGDARQWFFLAMAHWQLGHKDEAREWYDRAAKWIADHPTESSEAITYYQPEAADLLGMNLKSEVYLTRRARFAAAQERWDDAAADYAAALDVAADSRGWKSPKKTLCRQLPQSSEIFRRLVQLRPADTDLWIGRGEFYALRSQWSQAKSDYERVIRSRPIDNESLEYAGILLLVDEPDSYQKFCSELAAHDDQLKDPAIAHTVARACALGPLTAVDATQILQWASAGDDPPLLHVRGLAHYRTGQYDAALDDLTKSNAGGWGGRSKAQNWLVLAMAHHRLGHAVKAVECLDRARNMIQHAQPQNPGDPVSMPGTDWIEMNLLLREAEALIRPPATTSKPIANQPAADDKVREGQKTNDPGTPALTAI